MDGVDEVSSDAELGAASVDSEWSTPMFLLDGAWLLFVVAAFGYVSWYLWKRIIGYALLPAQVVHMITFERLEQQRKQALQNRPGELKRITITCPDNPKISLDGVEIVGKVSLVFTGKYERCTKHICCVVMGCVCC